MSSRTATETSLHHELDDSVKVGIISTPFGCAEGPCSEQIEYSDPETYSEYDEEEEEDSPASTEYYICENLKREEQQLSVRYADILALNPYFTPDKRESAARRLSSMIVDTLKLPVEAFLNAVMYMDIAMSKIAIPESEFMCFFITCFRLTLKMNHRRLGEMIDLNDVNTLLVTEYSAGDVAKMELKLIMTFDLCLQYPTSMDFTGMFLSIAQPSDARIEKLAVKLNGMAALNVNLIGVTPSVIAAAIVCVACIAFRYDEGVSLVLSNLSRSTKTIDLKRCVAVVIEDCRSMCASLEEGSVRELDFELDFFKELREFVDNEKEE